MVERSPEQKACDRLLLLQLIKYHRSLDAFKLQKISFRLEYELSQEGKRAFNYEFFQYDQGPLSIEIYEDREFLQQQSLISVNGYNAQITERGEALLSEVKSVLDQNRLIIDKLSALTERFASMSGPQMVQETHDMNIVWNGQKVRLGDLPKHSAVLSQPTQTDFTIEASALETLIILSHQELMGTLNSARTRGSVSSPYRPLITS